MTADPGRRLPTTHRADGQLPPVADLLRGMTGFRKAAILMMQLGRVESSRVLGNLSDRELEELSAEIARMGEVPRPRSRPPCWRSSRR